MSERVVTVKKWEAVQSRTGRLALAERAADTARAGEKALLQNGRAKGALNKGRTGEKRVDTSHVGENVTHTSAGLR